MLEFFTTTTPPPNIFSFKYCFKSWFGVMINKCGLWIWSSGFKFLSWPFLLMLTLRGKSLSTKLITDRLSVAQSLGSNFFCCCYLFLLFCFRFNSRRRFRKILILCISAHLQNSGINHQSGRANFVRCIIFPLACQ